MSDLKAAVIGTGFIGPAHIEALRRLGVEAGASLYMTLLAAFVALLHGAAGALVAYVAWRFRGPRAGLIALSLFAFAPWDILYGDRIWLSSVMMSSGERST